MARINANNCVCHYEHPLCHSERSELSTFEMDMSLCEKLFSKIKNASVIVAESGIYEYSQLKELHAQGADAFLIGEHFMRQEDLAKAVKTIKEG